MGRHRGEDGEFEAGEGCTRREPSCKACFWGRAPMPPERARGTKPFSFKPSLPWENESPLLLDVLTFLLLKKLVLNFLNEKIPNF